MNSRHCSYSQPCFLPCSTRSLLIKPFTRTLHLFFVIVIIADTAGLTLHPCSDTEMQILHFDWLRYYRSISNSHRVAKFAGFVSLFISFYSQINIFLAEFVIVFFCPTSWVILKQLDPSPSRATDQ